jgi:hypothetical protein
MKYYKPTIKEHAGSFMYLPVEYNVKLQRKNGEER